MAILVKFDGITGESDLTGFEGHIEVQSFAWGFSFPTRYARATGFSMTGEAAVQEVVISKVMDGSSTQLTQAALTRSLGGVVELHFVRTGPGSGPQKYASYKLEGCGISTYSVASGGDAPMETIGISFNVITFTHFKFDDELQPIPSTANYNLALG